MFVNLEGKLQNALKASYPPGEAKEDWLIFKDIANIMKKPLPFKNSKQLNELIKKNINKKITFEEKKTKRVNFVEEEIIIKPIDYYYTNPIARSSKVMNECRQITKKFLFTGIEKAN